MHLVEFFGIPGSGKSTIRNLLVNRLQISKKNYYLKSEEAYLLLARENIDLCFRILLKILPSKIAKKNIVKLFNRSILQFDAQNEFIAYNEKIHEHFFLSDSYLQLSHEDRAIIVSSFLENAAIYQAIKKYFSDEAILFFDEGFFQKTILFSSSEIYSKKNFQNSLYYLQSIPHPEVVIYLKNQATFCYERINDRFQGMPDRLKKKTKDQALRLLSNAEIHFDKTVTWILENIETEVIQISTNMPLSETVSKLEKVFINR